MSRVLAKRALTAHLDHPKPPVDLGAKVTRVGTDVLKIEYVIIGAVDELRFPLLALPNRADELWRHSCFEAFIGLGDDDEYVEFNFSPSREWAVYRFESHRRGMYEPIDLPAPDIYVEIQGSARFSLIAWVDISRLMSARPMALGLSAVLENQRGEHSYWSLAHPDGPPDFHDKACFAVSLADIARP